MNIATRAVPLERPTGPVAKTGALSHAEERLWFVDRLGGAGTRYTLQRALRLRGHLDTPLLHDAVDALVRRHEILRTRFEERDGAPYRIVDPPGRVPIRMECIPADDAAALDRILRELRNTAFSLQRGPLFRLALVRIGEVEQLLVRTVHHIIFDAWSDAIFNRELAEFYAAAREQRSPVLPPLEWQYSDYAAWERNDSDSGAEDHLAYWVNHLRGAAAIAFPGARGAASDEPPPHLGREIPEDVMGGIRQLSQSCGVTLYTTLLAAYAIVLTHFSRQAEVVIGTQAAVRPDRRLELLIGLFVNTLALRIHPDPAMDVRAFIRDTGRIVAEGAMRNRVPFERVVAALQPPRARNVPPVHQVSLVVQNAPRRGARFADVAGLDADPVPAPQEARDFLELHVRMNQRTAFCLWLRRADVLDEQFVVAMADAYDCVVRAFVAGPSRSIGQIRRELVGARGGAADGSRALTAATIPELFERQAARTPDRIAIVHDDTSWSYRYLNERANQLARWLVASGVGPEDLVGIALTRSVHLPMVLLAVLKAGGAYVPLDPDYPADRFRFMVRDASPIGVFVDAASNARLPDETRTWVMGTDGAHAPSAHFLTTNLTDAERSSPLLGDNAAYVVYTSGSSGEPKGVVGVHRGLINRLEWFASVHPFDSRGPVLAKTSLSFIDGSTELLGPLVAGGTIVVANTPLTASAHELVTHVRRHGVAQMTCVPAVLHALLDEKRPADLESCRLWLLSGETLRAALKARLTSDLPEAEIGNLYGVSEASGDSTYVCCRGDAITIGRAIWNTEIRLLDEQLQEVLPGSSGEICIAGAGLARGYLRRPALTAERFVADPYGAPGARIYRTGDVGRWTKTGELEYLGRLDRQVKIRGVRLELAELEAHFTSCATVREAAVIVRDGAGDSLLVAYVVPAPGRFVDTRDLRRQLTTVLPSAALSVVIVSVPELPRLANGKVDRSALAAIAPPQMQPEATRPYSTSEERALCEIFGQLFGRTDIQPEHDFFELGGHSLQAAKLVSLIRNRFDVMVPVQRVFESSRVEELAAHVSQLIEAETSVRPPGHP